MATQNSKRPKPLDPRPFKSRVTPTQIFIVAATLVILSAIGVFLSSWRNVLVPIAIALIFWFLITATARRINQFTLLPLIFAQILTTLIFGLGLYMIGRIILAQFNAIQGQLPVYQSRLEAIIDNFFGQEWVAMVGLQASDFTSLFQQFDLVAAVSAIAGTATNFATTFFFVLLYVFLLFIEQGQIPKKMSAIFGSGEARRSVNATIQQIQNRVQTYVAVKTLVSVLTAVVSFVVLWYFEVPFAAFWAFLIFLLNYIPNIGSTIAVTLPVLMALVETASFTTTALLAVLLTAIQQTFGSIVEPRMMGASLNISPFVVLVSLAVWGSMWGLPGMFLCVPLTVVAMIIMAEFPNTRGIALLLSRDGNLNRPVRRAAQRGSK